MGSKARILVVDDRERTVRAVQRILQKEGFEVLTALDGVTGLQKAQQEKPDLIILDVAMPGMDGYEVCRHLKADQGTAGIPVVMLTGKGRIDYGGLGFAQRFREQLEGFESGAVEFLTKPIRSKDLVSQVKKVLHLSDSQS